DDLAVHAELLEVARRPLGLLGDLLPGLEHPNRDGKRLGPDVEVQLPVGGLGVNHGLSFGAGSARPAPTGGGLPQARVAPLACSTALRRVWLRSRVQRPSGACGSARVFNGPPAPCGSAHGLPAEAYSLADPTSIRYRALAAGVARRVKTGERESATRSGRPRMQAPSASYSLTVRLEIVNKPGRLRRGTSTSAERRG